MLLIMQIADSRPMTIRTVTFVKIELSLSTFLKVIYQRSTIFILSSPLGTQ